ncbi:hypothetical protein OO014_07170 [Intrasporangium calvum]|uniref:Uncharacterized protein n=1 Tax=Intrasporangium calvum TaxID=53358 RepID=A0ABT5GH47_9MICO|nr:hypothetical protein [Intrasporangium calvum]MDC5697036.1 hypothetical protein [Intrasporangium calvum]
MDVLTLTLLLLMVFLGLLAVGWAQIAKGLNARVANGAVALCVATVVGVFAAASLFRVL